jgi:hypothetical protein
MQDTAIAYFCGMAGAAAAMTLSGAQYKASLMGFGAVGKKCLTVGDARLRYRGRCRDGDSQSRYGSGITWIPRRKISMQSS